MTEHIPVDLLDSILPAVLAIVIPIIVATFGGGYVLFKRYLKNGSNALGFLVTALDDNNIDSAEYKELKKRLLILFRNDPDAGDSPTKLDK